jgi:hypothetical protein
MRRVGFLAVVVVTSLGLVEQQPVLNADSLYDLHDSADRVKWSLQLSPDEFASLEQALEVLVGDDARRLMQALETMEGHSKPLPASVRLAAESRVLAPIEGLSFEDLVTAAVDKTVDRRTALLGDLRAEKQLSALLLDCRLIDSTRRQTRERGTCRVDFPADLLAGTSATATAPVAWETRQRLGWVVEARPIKAYGPDGDMLWEVSSEIDPRAGGRLAEIENSIADLDHDLQALRVDRLALR